LVLKNGEKHSMKGFAVDPSTKSAGVRSGVNHRYITRWGSLIASSFLEGFAEAVQQSGSKTSSNVGGDYGTTVTERPVYNTSEQVWIAAGKVGEKVGKKAEKYFDTPSTVTLKEGIPIGVLIIDIDKGVI
jgi:type IV secretory pathway VirB10-like protein